MKFLIARLGLIGRRHLHNQKALGETYIFLYRMHCVTPRRTMYWPGQSLSGLAGKLFWKKEFDVEA
jgi:hypothetical protein